MDDQERRKKRAEYMRRYREQNPAYIQRERERAKDYQKKRREDESFREAEKKYKKVYNAKYIKAHKAEALERQKKWLASPAGLAYTEKYKARRQELAALKKAAKLKTDDNQPTNE